jgi:hypothetical protein
LAPAVTADSGATIAQLTARLDEQASQTQKVSAQLELSKPAPQVVVKQTVNLRGRAALGVRRQGEFGKPSAPAPNAFTVSALLLSSCSVFAAEKHAIPAVSACNTPASIQPCEFGAGHAFQSYSQIFVLLSFFSDNRGAKFLKIFQKAETLPRFWNLQRRQQAQHLDVERCLSAPPYIV